MITTDKHFLANDYYNASVCDDATVMIVVELIVMIDGRAEWPLFPRLGKVLDS
jgi:hypothetical protein